MLLTVLISLHSDACPTDGQRDAGVEIEIARFRSHLHHHPERKEWWTMESGEIDEAPLKFFRVVRFRFNAWQPIRINPPPSSPYISPYLITCLVIVSFCQPIPVPSKSHPSLHPPSSLYLLDWFHLLAFLSLLLLLLLKWRAAVKQRSKVPSYKHLFNIYII